MTDTAPLDRSLAAAPRDEAIPALLQAYGGQLHSLGLRFCGDATEAEDLVQETFLQAWRGWDAFEGRSDPRTWLYTIAARACQRLHRRRAGEPSHLESLDELLPFGQPRIAVIPDGDGEDGLLHQLNVEAREQVEQAIVGLPEDFRIPLVLRDIVGIAGPDVARILGIEEGTVKSRVHRARLKIRQAVDRVLPRSDHQVPPPYPRQVCLDLLAAKQEALDRGVPFDQEVLCERCRSVFASLDLAHDVCAELGREPLPDELRQRMVARLAAEN